MSSTEQPDKLIGQQIGNYRVTRLIGAGGMGAVYEAIHEQINRRAAIKVLHAETVANPELGRRFINEARAVNQIAHPGIVQVFDFGSLPSNEPYIAMEFLEGETLSERIERLGKMPERDVVRIGRQVASALTAAHEKQIIHRDLKPDNIMLVADKESPGRERAKVLDFGIAKLQGTGSAGATGGSGTRTHAILGTAPYMSPEQCRGSHQITERTDVYALGIVLYEMLTGHPPFVAEEEVEVMTMHIKSPPPPLRKALPSISKPLEELIGRMLSKAPVSRPLMNEVYEQFESLSPGSLSGTIQVFEVPQPPTISQYKRPLLLAGIGIAAVVGLASAVLRTPTPDQHPGKAITSPPDMTAVKVSTATAAITWQITSEPDGASVLDGSTREEIGKTPWTHSQVVGTGEHKVIVRKNGYEPKELILRQDQNEQKHVKLSLKVLDL